MFILYFFIIVRNISVKAHKNCSDNIKCQQPETESVCVARLPQSYLNEPYKNYGCESVTFLLL